MGSSTKFQKLIALAKRKKNVGAWFFVSIILIAFILRLALAPFAFHVDIFSNAGWGEWIYLYGPRGFYENDVWIYSWPTQLPLANLVYGFASGLYVWFLELFRSSTNIIVAYRLAPSFMVWWFNFVMWFDNAISIEIAFPFGFLLTIKLFAILADIGIAFLVYWFALKLKSEKPFLWAILYLFSPFSWYLSALWGQYDQIGFFLLLLSFIFQKSAPILSPIFFVLSFSIKPTSLIFLPLYFWLYLKHNFKSISFIVGGILSLLILYLSIHVFTSKNVIYYLHETLIPKVFFKSELRVSTNSYNFWHIFTLDKALNHSKRFLFIPANIWGILLFSTVNILAFMKIKKFSYQNLFKAMYIVGAGGWFFLTNMLERYFFAGVVSGLFVSISNPKLLKYWIVTSLVFWLNLYRGWWFPPWMEGLKYLLTSWNGIAGLVISSINLLVFVKMTQVIMKKS